MTNLPAIISRKEAIAKGLTHFFSGRPCKRGHILPRSVKEPSCKPCRKIDANIRYKNRDKSKPWSSLKTFEKLESGFKGKPCNKCGNTFREKSLKCPTCRTEKRHSNIEHENAIAAKSREKNREKINQRARGRYKNNKSYSAEYSVFRRINKINANPFSMNENDRIRLRGFLNKCPEGFHSDHIVPLVSDKVCGLHCVANMQYLPSLENIRKRNAWPTCQRSMQPAWFDTLIWYMSAE